jgi:ABC-type lipoprotein export system ATPase subunit
MAVFDHVDLQIRRGSHTVVTGRSGSGKTTLLLVLAGLLVPSEGTVRWPGLSTDPRRRRADIGMVFQAPSLMPELNAVENVTLPMRLRGTSIEESRLEAQKALGVVGGSDLADARPDQLSGGQQQRVAVARALAGKHRLILADEPAGSLDRVHAHQIVDALRAAIAAEGGALVLATHDDELAAEFPERLEITGSAPTVVP